MEEIWYELRWRPMCARKWRAVAIFTREEDAIYEMATDVKVQTGQFQVVKVTEETVSKIDNT